MNITISIVTFLQRKELIKNLIPKIRQIVPKECDILLAINGNYDEVMPNDYRIEMLELAKSYDNVYPIFCADFMSLSKLWNTLVLFSKTEYNFIICDDVVIDNPSMFDNIVNYIDNTKEEFFTINDGFSHFVLTKSFLHKIGYFDERLLAYGEEDGDMVLRYIKTFDKNVPNLQIADVYNAGAYHLKMNDIDTHINNKPTINREIIKIKYRDDINGICGMGITPVVPSGLLKDVQQYPYEEFVRNNRYNIKKFQQVILD